MERIVSPSILAIDFRQLPMQIKRAEISAQWFHYDVMDGVFVDNISFGPDILKQISSITDRVMDVHLMIQNPVKYFDAFIQSGADAITFHVEAVSDIEAGLEAVEYLHEHGVKAGITLRPSTPLESIIPYLKHVDIVLVMSVEPGFGGQAFIPSMFDRIATIHEMRKLNNYKFLISVDGGINQETGAKARQKGVDILVAGSYVFKGDIEKAVSSLL